jgi:hypothetical protein
MKYFLSIIRLVIGLVIILIFYGYGFEIGMIWLIFFGMIETNIKNDKKIEILNSFRSENKKMRDDLKTVDIVLKFKPIGFINSEPYLEYKKLLEEKLKDIDVMDSLPGNPAFWRKHFNETPGHEVVKKLMRSEEYKSNKDVLLHRFEINRLQYTVLNKNLMLMTDKNHTNQIVRKIYLSGQVFGNTFFDGSTLEPTIFMEVENGILKLGLPERKPMFEFPLWLFPVPRQLLDKSYESQEMDLNPLENKFGLVPQKVKEDILSKHGFKIEFDEHDEIGREFGKQPPVTWYVNEFVSIMINE